MTPNQTSVAHIRRMLINVETERKALLRTLAILERQEPHVNEQPLEEERRGREGKPQTFQELFNLELLFAEATEALVSSGMNCEEAQSLLEEVGRVKT